MLNMRQFTHAYLYCFSIAYKLLDTVLLVKYKNGLFLFVKNIYIQIIGSGVSIVRRYRLWWLDKRWSVGFFYNLKGILYLQSSYFSAP